MQGIHTTEAARCLGDAASAGRPVRGRPRSTGRSDHRWVVVGLRIGWYR